MHLGGCRMRPQPADVVLDASSCVSVFGMWDNPEIFQTLYGNARLHSPINKGQLSAENRPSWKPAVGQMATVR